MVKTDTLNLIKIGRYDMKKENNKNPKKSILIKITAVTLLCVISLLAFTSCGNKAKREVVFELKGTKIHRDVYEYWLSYYKSSYLDMFKDLDDTEESWKQEIDGTPVWKTVIGDVDTKLKNMLCALYLFKQYDLSLSKATKEQIQEDIQAAIDYFGTKSEMNRILNKLHGFTANRLEDIYEMEEKVDTLRDYLYGKNGIERVTNAEIDKFYKENYSLIKLIYINNKYDLQYDEDGFAKVGADGNYIYKSTPLTKAEQEAKMKKAEQALARAKNGEDFDELIKEYSEVKNDYFRDTPNGYYVVPYEPNNPVPIVFNEAFDMEIGETRLVHNEYIICVIQRVPLREKAYNDSKDYVQFANLEYHCINEKFGKKLQKLFDEIKVNESVYNLYTTFEAFDDISENFQFYYYKKD